MATRIGYMGAGFLVAAQWTLEPVLYILGFICVMIQVASRKQWNLVALNLNGLFGVLPNIAWTNKGPIDIGEINESLHKAKVNKNDLYIKSVDKFPCMTDYVVPKNVRIADASRVRLGAYLSEGTTVMHEGFVNFNAGTLGKAMIEGRISAGVVVGNNSDLGGGSSTMGTLSGGNEVKISIGENCLLGANAGIGISLGNSSISGLKKFFTILSSKEWNEIMTTTPPTLRTSCSFESVIFK